MHLHTGLVLCPSTWRHHHQWLSWHMHLHTGLTLSLSLETTPPMVILTYACISTQALYSVPQPGDTTTNGYSDICTSTQALYSVPQPGDNTTNGYPNICTSTHTWRHHDQWWSWHMRFHTGLVLCPSSQLGDTTTNGYSDICTSTPVVELIFLWHCHAATITPHAYKDIFPRCNGAKNKQATKQNKANWLTLQCKAPFVTK